MSGVGSRETGLDSLFASKPVGPGFEPCLGQSAKLAGAPKPLCLSVCHRLTSASRHEPPLLRRIQMRLIKKKKSLTCKAFQIDAYNKVNYCQKHE